MRYCLPLVFLKLLACQCKLLLKDAADWISLAHDRTHWLAVVRSEASVKRLGTFYQLSNCQLLENVC